jgi:hypothetical protein
MKSLSKMMELLPGLSISIQIDGSTIIPEDNGYLGSFKNGMFSLMLKSSNQSLRAFTADGRKNITQSKNYTPTMTEATYRYRIEIKEPSFGNRFPFTQYPNNNIRVLVEDGNHLEIIEVAIIGQWGKFFLSVQKTYSFEVFQNQGNLECPAQANWPSLMSYLAIIFDNRISELPVVSTNLPTTIKTPATITQGTGVVTWFNNAMRCGCCYLEIDGKIYAARILADQVETDNKELISFEQGEIIQIAGYTKPDSERTNFRYEVFGVQKMDTVLA